MDAPGAKSRGFTVFAENIPDKWDIKELETYFGEVGPVKKCFIVSGGKNKTARNLAYVTYALEEDVDNAVKQLHGKTFENHKLKVKAARPKKSKKLAEVKRNFDFDRKARLVIRNLSFKANEDLVRKHFEKHGDVAEVALLRSRDGKKLTGCGFVQFCNTDDASNAIEKCNAKELLGRPIAVDWAVSKQKFVEAERAKPNSDTKQAEDNVNRKKRKRDESEDNVKRKKKEKRKQEEEPVINKKASENRDSSDEEDSLSEGSSDESDPGENDDSDTEKTNESKTQTKSGEVRGPSKDIAEGRTIFIKEVPFDASQEQLQSEFEQFGAVKYALKCIDPLTEHPKGTAFLQFQEKSSVDKCLKCAINDGIYLDGTRLFVRQAISREQLKEKKNSDEKKPSRDKRNLYLAKEGYISASSPAASSVSRADLAKRLNLDVWKRTMLKNLNMFVSPERLCVHNLPLDWSDKKLKKLFLKHTDEDAKITESRIMRDLHNMDEHGVGRSKGYGFVTFTDNDHALQALRAINNNPNIFTKDARPIVEFSVENRAALNAKHRRLIKSREKVLEGRDKENKEKKNKKFKTPRPFTSENKKEVEKSEYSGVISEPGKKLQPGKRPRQRDIKAIAGKGKITRKMLREKQKPKKKLRVVEDRKAKSSKANKAYRRNRSDQHFDRMVNKHRKKKQFTAPKRRGKWFDG